MNKLDPVGMLGINDEDVLATFPQEEQSHSALQNITQEQLMDIAPLAWDKIVEGLGDTFWETFADCVKEAAMEVLDLSYNDDYELEDENDD
jgi:hypothetical protein